MIKVYTLYNKTLKQYYSPFCDADTEAVKRSMYDVVNAPNDNYIKIAPANYAVMEIGEFDHTIGKISTCKPKLVVELADLKEDTNGN